MSKRTSHPWSQNRCQTPSLSRTMTLMERMRMSPALQRIVKFYEAHPYFYNLRHEKYRNTKLKEAELAELAKEIKWTGE